MELLSIDKSVEVFHFMYQCQNLSCSNSCNYIAF